MDFNTVIQNRYSCRAFAAQEIEPEKVEVILTPVHFQPGLSGQIENKPYTFLLKTGRVVGSK